MFLDEMDRVREQMRWDGIEGGTGRGLGIYINTLTHGAAGWIYDHSGLTTSQDLLF